LREERNAILIGTYERACVPCLALRLRGISVRTCCPTTWSGLRRAWKSPSSTSRLLAEAGIAKVVNGPFTFAPDGKSARRPGEGAEELLGGVWSDGRFQPGRRRWSRAVALDGGWRSWRGCLGNGCLALRRLGDSPLHKREGPENYSRRFRHSVSERGTHCGAAFAHDTYIRPVAGRARRVW